MKKIYVLQHNENPWIFIGVFDSKEEAMYSLMSMDLSMGDRAKNLYKNREELLKEYSILEAELNEEKIDCPYYAIMRNGNDLLELVPTENDAEHDKKLFQKEHPNDEITIETRML